MNCEINNNGNTANLGDAVRIASCDLLRALNGQVVTFNVHADLMRANLPANATDEQRNRRYAGLVPVVGGVEQPQAALLAFDLLQRSVNDYKTGNLVFAPLTDALHTTAQQTWHAGITFQQFFEAIAGTPDAPRRWKLGVHEYAARNQHGGIWNACVLTAEPA